MLHSQLRLAVISLLIGVEEADFVYIKDMTGATSGNLSIQLDKLKEAGYIGIVKSFKGKKPNTTCRITPEGIDAFEAYVRNLQEYISRKEIKSTGANM